MVCFIGGPDRIDKAVVELQSGLGDIELYVITNEHSVKRIPNTIILKGHFCAKILIYWRTYANLYKF
jgi:hypothetical protein